MDRNVYASRWLLALFAVSLLPVLPAHAQSATRPATRPSAAAGAAVPGGVAVVDLDRVATDLGWVSKLQTNMTAYQKQLRDEVIKQDEATRGQQSGQLQQMAGEMYQAYQQESLKRYRDALQPIVQRIARERHILLVVTQTGTVVYADPSIDITDAVTDAARAEPPVVTAVPMPSMGGGGATTRPAR